MEEEINGFRNDFDCATVQWQATLENEQRFHAVDVGKRQEAEKQLSLEKSVRQQAEEKLSACERLLAASKRACEAAEHDSYHTVASATAAASAVTASWLWLPWLRYPKRRPDGGSPVAGALNATRWEPGPLCQAVVWQVSSMRGVSAVFCAHPSLRILEATKSALALWGSAALRGTSLATLVSTDASAEWFTEEVAGSSAPGSMDRRCGPTEFWLQDMGCLEFRSRLVVSFDSSVMRARLPPEPWNALVSVLCMVFEPMTDDQMPQPRGGVSAAFSGRVPQAAEHSRRDVQSGAVSVTSDITANDSVSNVNNAW